MHLYSQCIYAHICIFMYEKIRERSGANQGKKWGNPVMALAIVAKVVVVLGEVGLGVARQAELVEDEA